MMKAPLSFITNACCLFVLGILFSGQSYAQTYTTLSDGDWDDVTGVWSLDAVTPCMCTPGQDVDAFAVVVSHDIQLTTYDVWIKNNGTLDIKTNASIIDPGIIYSLYIENGVVISLGTINLKGTEIKPLGFFFMSGSTTFDDKFFLEGEATLNTLLTIANADVQIEPGGIMNFQGSPEVNMMNGNMVNEGTINYTDTCTILTVSNGNVNNTPAGVVNGNAAIVVENGGINNTGSWSVDMQWCASGPGVGLPTPEDCGATNCNESPLPVTLLFFDVTKTSGNLVKIEWSTASEINNNYFLVERSTDVMNWSIVTSVTGAGNSNQVQSYTTNDVLNVKGTYYYRLTQVDHNGESETSDYRTVTCNDIPSDIEINLFPNPTSEFVMLGINGNVDTDLHVEIMNLSGQIMLSSVLPKGISGEQRLNLTGFESGIYLVRITGVSVSQSTRLIVR